MTERPCDCSKRHQVWTKARWNVQPATHQHEDARCDERHVGIGGCPGLPHCRDWIIGCYTLGEMVARLNKDLVRELGLQLTREGLEREFALRAPLNNVTGGS